MPKKKRIKVVVSGAAGRMGQESVRAILKESDDMELVGAVGLKGTDQTGKDIGEIIGTESVGITLVDNLKDCLQRTTPDVMLDFTVPSSVFKNACISLDCGVRPVLGTTGLSEDDLRELEKKAKFATSAVLVAPNFAIGALLMIEAAKKFAKYFDEVEIIELHHNKKVDAPSGTSIKTARELSKIITQKQLELSADTEARGKLVDNIRIHSVRLQGLLAHQEVIFGGIGQCLTVRHDTFNRTAFMPGVILAIKQIVKRKGLIYGLENLLD